MIEFTGTDQIPEFNHQLDLAMLELDLALSARFDAFTKEMFRELVSDTPQWSGDLAASWNYSLNEPDMTYFELPNKIEAAKHVSVADVFRRGDQPAVGVALAQAALVRPTWRDIVYFTNPAPIAPQVDDQTIVIRPVNLVNGQLHMTQFYYEKYSMLGGSW